MAIININKYNFINLIDGETNKPSIYGDPNNLTIGNNIGFNNVILNLANNITIENDVFFGHNVMILTGLHDYSKKGSHRLKDVSKSLPVIIKQGAWIASGSIIFPGITIGKNAVVGAGSIVNKDIPDNELWVGNPIRFIKKI